MLELSKMSRDGAPTLEEMAARALVSTLLRHVYPVNVNFSEDDTSLVPIPNVPNKIINAIEIAVDRTPFVGFDALDCVKYVDNKQIFDLCKRVLPTEVTIKSGYCTRDGGGFDLLCIVLPDKYSSSFSKILRNRGFSEVPSKELLTYDDPDSEDENPMHYDDIPIIDDGLMMRRENEEALDDPPSKKADTYNELKQLLFELGYKKSTTKNTLSDEHKERIVIDWGETHNFFGTMDGYSKREKEFFAYNYPFTSKYSVTLSRPESTKRSLEETQ